MLEIKYSYAHDAQGKLVKIDEAKSGAAYRCPNCGNDMIARMGEVNAHHFAHRVECRCDGESYLHLMAKTLFRQAFDSADVFYLEYRDRRHCPVRQDYYGCPFGDQKCSCFSPGTRKLNLKSVFDTCIVEAPVEGGKFVADILLTSRQTGKQLLIEFYHRHKCTPEKINSGLPIIEIRVDSEDDFITGNRIPVSKKVTYYGFKTVMPPGKSLFLVTFSDARDGNDLSVQELNCHKIFETIPNNRLLGDAAFAVAIEGETFVERRMEKKFSRLSVARLGCAIAYDMGFCTDHDFTNCGACVFSRFSKFDSKQVWCTQSKEYSNMPRNPGYDHAVSCPMYFASMKYIRSLSRNLGKFRYKVLRSNPRRDDYSDYSDSFDFDWRNDM